MVYFIAGFPGTGKTYCCEHQSEFGGNVDFRDSKSGKFRYNKKLRKDDAWVGPYVDELIQTKKSLVDDNIHFIFVSPDECVMKEMHKKNQSVVMVVPDNKPENIRFIKNQYFGRYLLRDNKQIVHKSYWVRQMDKNFEYWISDEFVNRYNPRAVIRLPEHYYMKDAINLILKGEIW